jgi:hypothetical protein
VMPPLPGMPPARQEAERCKDARELQQSREALWHRDTVSTMGPSSHISTTKVLSLLANDAVR